MPFLGAVPCDPKVVISGDEGMPVVLADSDSRAAQAFNMIVDRLLEKARSRGGKP